MKKVDEPVHDKLKWRDALCGARAKQNNHQPCKQPAMKNGRCRLHGGKSTGAKTPEGKLRAATANYKHGKYSALEKARQQVVRDMMGWREDLI